MGAPSAQQAAVVDGLKIPLSESYNNIIKKKKKQLLQLILIPAYVVVVWD